MTSSQRLSITLLLSLFTAVLPAQEDPGRPKRMSIEPNAILREGQPLTIEVGGILKKGQARIWVVQDCDSDGRPDEAPECATLYDVQSDPADAKDVVRHRIEFSQMKDFPRGKTLWLRCARPDSKRFRQAMFGLVEDECSVLETVADVFVRGDCKPGLLQVLRRHRQPTDLTRAIFEVRRLAVGDPSSEPVSIPGTRGASGVTWLDDDTLLVTASGLADGGSLPAGLYRVPLAADAKPELLWSPGEDERGAVAPLALPRGRVAFVRQKTGTQQSGADAKVAWLTVLKLKGRVVEQEVALPYKVHQLLAVGKKGKSVLALSLGIADNLPVLLVVPVGGKDTETEVVGFTNALYQSVMREPGGEQSVVAFENAAAGRGWQLVLAEGAALKRDLVKRDDRHDLAPAWRPRGGELVYLAQIGVVR